MKVNSDCNLLTSESTTCADSTPLCFLTTLYLLFKLSTIVTKISSFPILIISPGLNFWETVGSCNFMNVLIPVAAVFPIATVKFVLEVTTPTVLNPSMFLYTEEDIPDISTRSKSKKLWGTVLNAVTCLFLNANVRLLWDTSVVATETTVLPKTSLTLALARLELKLINSLTL